MRKPEPGRRGRVMRLLDWLGSFGEPKREPRPLTRVARMGSGAGAGAAEAREMREMAARVVNFIVMLISVSGEVQR